MEGLERDKDTAVLTALTLLNWDKNNTWSMIELMIVNLKSPWFDDTSKPH